AGKRSAPPKPDQKVPEKMKLRLPLAAAILLPVTLTISATAVLAMILSAMGNMAMVEKTLADRQDEMISVLTEQFAGSVRFAKMEAVEESFTQYKADPDFGLSAAGAVDAQGNALLEFGDDAQQVESTTAIAREALERQEMVSVTQGNHHIAAYPAYFGK